MFDDDLDRLLSRGPDRTLDRLEREVWERAAAQEQAARWGRRLLALQAVLLLVVLIGSAVAGQHWRDRRHSTTLDVFSPEMPLSASTLLDGRPT